MASQEKISVYNLADLKNTSDDAIPNYLNSLKFRQSHRLTDIRLTLGYGALAIAAACLGWDYKFGFDATKYYTAAAVALYSLLNGALTLWIFYVERGTIYEGTAPSSAGGDTIRISTHTKKNVPEYNVTVEVTGKDGKKKGKVEVTKPFTEWFDATGHFVAAPFQSVLATAVPAVGKADPKRVAGPKEGAAATTTTTYTPEILEALAAGTLGSETSGAEPKSGKKGERRRKA
ncbi:microsomal signal peptidase 25 kDa subunit-domain-containing protein [Immersiella caudata]|uniref:Signal peptidase complex subunit 2 n=1 Tax=Immersiella caudata TaxID=314043 RepID=A0AA40CBD5_9PEZI|nr:microsomal signal peptidase 25 kDa subunit-domain-containing protein [Immersiella caudata]